MPKNPGISGTYSSIFRDDDVEAISPGGVSGFVRRGKLGMKNE
jgi:hypothetical protein